MSLGGENLKTLLSDDSINLLFTRVMRGESIIHELREHCGEYGISRDQVIDFALENLAYVKELTDTYGMSLYKEAYPSQEYEIFQRKGTVILKDVNGHANIVSTHVDSKQDMEEFTRQLAGQTIVYCVCRDELWDALYSMFVEPEVINVHASSTVSTSNIGISSNANMDTDARKIYRELVNIGLRRNASDVHFIPCSDDCKVLYRIDGRYELYNSIPLGFLDRLFNIITNDAAIAIGATDKPIDGQMMFSPSGQPKDKANDAVPIRVSIFVARTGKDIDLRYLSDRLYTFEELGMSGRIITQYKRIAQEKRGLIVQTGAVGTGKSTSLYSILNEAHKTWRNIQTFEDPVEIRMDGITQVDVGQKGQMSFAEALRGDLRHDPDVVVVGELRDQPTAEEALKIADAGKLVITSLHTNDAIGTFERLVNLHIDPYSVGEVLTYSLGQTLIRRLCPYCKKEYIVDPSDPDLRDFHLENYFGHERFKAFKACGCSKCRNIGYAGRASVNEILHVDTELRYLIQCRSKRKEYEEHLNQIGYISLYEDALNKVRDGITSLEEIYDLAADSLVYKGPKFSSPRKGGD